MKKYFLKRADKDKTKNKISDKIDGLKRMAGRFCLNLTEKIGIKWIYNKYRK